MTHNHQHTHAQMNRLSRWNVVSNINPPLHKYLFLSFSAQPEVDGGFVRLTEAARSRPGRQSEPVMEYPRLNAQFPKRGQSFFKLRMLMSVKICVICEQINKTRLGRKAEEARGGIDTGPGEHTSGHSE